MTREGKKGPLLHIDQFDMKVKQWKAAIRRQEKRNKVRDRKDNKNNDDNNDDDDDDKKTSRKSLPFPLNHSLESLEELVRSIKSKMVVKNDDEDKDTNSRPIHTLQVVHTAKGLQFSRVYIHDDFKPEDTDFLELCYTAMTRASKDLRVAFSLQKRIAEAYEYKKRSTEEHEKRRDNNNNNNNSNNTQSPHIIDISTRIEPFYDANASNNALFIHYVLSLEDRCFYVGRARSYRLCNERIAHHFSGRGSQWTQLHPPRCEYTRRFWGDAFTEDATVKKMMHTYGIDCVRGGTYTTATLSERTQSFLQHEIQSASNQCYRCKTIGHCASQCPKSGCGKRDTPDIDLGADIDPNSSIPPTSAPVSNSNQQTSSSGLQVLDGFFYSPSSSLFSSSSLAARMDKQTEKKAQRT
jgi:predicted GIY-YIG superfamily endonuclease